LFYNFDKLLNVHVTKKLKNNELNLIRFSPTDPSNNESREVSKSQQVQREKAMVKTLIYLALSFVVLTLPANIFYFLMVFASQIEKNYLLVNEKKFAITFYLIVLYRLFLSVIACNTMLYALTIPRDSVAASNSIIFKVGKIHFIKCI
jgi:hypothetical protein